MSDMESWTVLVPIFVPTLCAIFAGVALVLNTIAITESKRTRELQTFYGIFKDLINLEEKQREYYLTEEGKKAWNSLFFNTLEFFSFLLNEKFLKDPKVLVFFEDAVKAFYEQVFVKHIPAEKQKDVKVYPEFKKLYARIREKKI
jgi:hypothetical protein